ncbi:hypothetical protein DGI_1980 [Megalodesulfovibrio gigas DSM 1382 = ATCC 19364]|uniref:Uncharacterized protein n=2 Tax=Megalodesulfovibrio gigas TaxID=879 RepID=T2GCA9_MEGG1|nr:hypothetical protein DGI_1980 [Megalodesulfovibrio gigas DSM 1382 = ATCC 19364]
MRSRKYLMHIALVFTLAAASGWEFWPFDAIYPSNFWPFLAKIGFVALIFGGVVLYLRKLFGPGGRLRPEGLETIQEARAREARERQAVVDQAQDGSQPEGQEQARAADTPER